MSKDREWLIGLTLTCVGVILLLFVFYLGYREFVKYSYIPTQPTDFTHILSMLFYVSMEVILLAVMCWVASIILARGLDFFRIGRSTRREIKEGEPVQNS
ncbi:MAG: hypothetical protein NZ955_05370 [Candidatus Bathyarchaeota archaeon]|nr:hypothetical protein [Candidatus Bathyarchaeota archaeon]MCX8162519.1 hypothetical protein [Candidatus Bathyarchaeota archaeon]